MFIKKKDEILLKIQLDSSVNYRIITTKKKVSYKNINFWSCCSYRTLLQENTALKFKN